VLQLKVFWNKFVKNKSSLQVKLVEEIGNQFGKYLKVIQLDGLE